MVETEAPSPFKTYREAIAAFLFERLEVKLEKLKSDTEKKRQQLTGSNQFAVLLDQLNSDEEMKRQELTSSHQPVTWLEDAARRVQQIQAVTHSLKPIHPDAKGTNLYVEPTDLPVLDVLGSHVLGTNFSGDVVGNAAALDVYKLLKLEVNQRSLLQALLAQESEALTALHPDPKQSQVLSEAFVSLTQPRLKTPSSHTLAKQLYWLTGSDASDDANYTLLAPLYATSLAHAVHAEIQEHKFGDTNKAARQARRERKGHAGVFHEYPGLAVQNMGGTKPQNISQLNSERRGVNYLFSSLPPQWQNSAIRLPVNVTSVFNGLFRNRPEVRLTVRALRHFLESNPEPTLATRQYREALLDTLVDELVSLATELQQTMSPGWTLDENRFKSLHRSEQLWLDPLRAELPEESEFAREWLRLEWPISIGQRFANWLNTELRGKLPMGDAEARQWGKELLTDEDGFGSQLRALRQRLDNSVKEVTP